MKGNKVRPTLESLPAFHKFSALLIILVQSFFRLSQTDCHCICMLTSAQTKTGSTSDRNLPHAGLLQDRITPLAGLPRPSALPQIRVRSSRNPFRPDHLDSHNPCQGFASPIIGPAKMGILRDIPTANTVLYIMRTSSLRYKMAKWGSAH